MRRSLFAGIALAACLGALALATPPPANAQCLAGGKLTTAFWTTGSPGQNSVVLNVSFSSNHISGLTNDGGTLLDKAKAVQFAKKPQLINASIETIIGNGKAKERADSTGGVEVAASGADGAGFGSRS